MDCHLANRDYTLIIDKSGSMCTDDMHHQQTRWSAAEETTYAIASKVFKYDPNGIDIWLFSNSFKHYRNVGPEVVSQIFKENEPCGGTRLAEVLELAINEYFEKKKKGMLSEKGEMILVITDGAPDDGDRVIQVLTEGINKLEAKDKLSINFIQVGHDRSAAQFLKFLDNDLAKRVKAQRDCVETIKIEEVEKIGLTQMLLDTLEKTR